MKIIRDGVEIELTKDELYEAWNELAHIYTLDALRWRIVERITSAGFEIDDEVLETLVNDAERIYIKDRDYGCEEEWSFDDASIEVSISYMDANQNTIS